MKNRLITLLLFTAFLSSSAYATNQIDIQSKGINAGECFAYANFLGYTVDEAAFSRLVDELATQLTLQSLLATSAKPQNELGLIRMTSFNKGFFIGSGDMKKNILLSSSENSDIKNLIELISKQYEMKCNRLL